jgi:hypothetical protein
MFGVGVGVRVGGFTASSGGGFDPDAQAFFDRVTTAGGTLSTTEKNATNQLVLDMKSAGIWSSMKAIYPMVGASAAACAQNLKSSSFTGTFTSGWTFASTGVTPNGTSAYMNTSFQPSTQSSLNNAHYSIYIRTNQQEIASLGASDSGYNNIVYMNPRYTDDKWYNHLNGGGSDFASSTNSNGFWQISTIASGSFSTFRNNSKLQTKTRTAQGLTSNNIWLGGANTQGALEYSSRQCAFASIGDGLTDTQASNFYTAVQAFQTTLSRQV